MKEVRSSNKKKVKENLKRKSESEAKKMRAKRNNKQFNYYKNKCRRKGICMCMCV